MNSPRATIRTMPTVANGVLPRGGDSDGISLQKNWPALARMGDLVVAADARGVCTGRRRGRGDRRRAAGRWASRHRFARRRDAHPIRGGGPWPDEKDGRVLYPAMRNPMLGGLLREMLGPQSPLTTGGPVREQAGGLIRGFLAAQPPRLTIYFLFRGDEPLSMTLEARKSYALQAVPRRDPMLHRRLLEAWWRDYSAPPPVPRKARLSADGGKLPRQFAGAAAQLAAAGPSADRIGLRPIGARVGRVAGDRIDPRGPRARPRPGPDELFARGRSAPAAADRPAAAGGPRAGGEGRGRADRDARPGGVVLRPLRQLQQFPLAPGHAGDLGRRHAEPRRPARPRLRPQRAACSGS